MTFKSSIAHTISYGHHHFATHATSHQHQGRMFRFLKRNAHLCCLTTYLQNTSNRKILSTENCCHDYL